MSLHIRVLAFSAFDTEEKRQMMASIISGTVNRQSEPGLPYKVHANDSYEFVVDRSNDWRVIFDQSDASVYRLWHRYDHAQAIAALSQWLAYHFGGVVHDTSGAIVF